MEFKTSLEKYAAYPEQVYAGVLGKIIGVYVGRPFEQWSHKRIMEELGEIEYYVHDRLGHPLIVTDDDISGTFAFLRALEEHDYDPNITSQQIGKTWLNQIVSRRTILWWGGVGQSTEHTAFHRLKSGIPAPESGSIARNGKTVAEQIGAQIFIDGWGLLCPGDPAAAVSFAERAARVSHDGEAVVGAQMIAAMIACAFDGGSIEEVIEKASEYIPQDSMIRALVDDVRQRVANEPDYLKGFPSLDETYGYHRYPGGCHIIPNHALILFALFHGKGSFAQSMKVVNTCGWDTDCNAANVGTILGVLNGLNGLHEKDWRGPVADRLYVAAAAPHRVISDAAQEAQRIVQTAHLLRGEQPPYFPTYNFEFPDSVQGWSPVEYDFGAILISGPADTEASCFTWLESLEMKGYELMGSPTLMTGQTIGIVYEDAHVAPPFEVVLEYQIDAENKREIVAGHHFPKNPQKEYQGTVGQTGHLVTITVPETKGFPIRKLGIRLLEEGTLRIAGIEISGTPVLDLTNGGSPAQQLQWMNAVDDWSKWSLGFRLSHESGDGLFLHGAGGVSDVSLAADIHVTLAQRCGLVLGCSGLRRYLGLVLTADGQIQLIQQYDDETIVLAEERFRGTPFSSHPFRFSALYVPDREATILEGSIGDNLLRIGVQGRHPGSVGYLISEGRIDSPLLSIRPVARA